jgi:hypothetical protein
MELVERLYNAERYHIDGDSYALKMGGDIEDWALPFDGGACAPWNLLWSERVVQGNWGWLGKGTQGYAVHLNRGIARVFPVRGDQTKYIQISGLSDNECQVNQIDNKNLEIFADQEYTRWSLKMGPDGFKPEIVLKPGWTGDQEWQFKFELNGGLALEGKKIMDGATPVLVLRNPFVIDNNGTIFPAQESLVDGEVTITADLTGAVFPCTVDPTLGPINPNKDAWIYQATPTSGWGQNSLLQLYNGAGGLGRIVMQADISAIPPGSIIDSSILELKSTSSSGAGRQIDFYRLTVDDWEDDGSGTLNAECNWTNYKDGGVGGVAWPGGSGALGDTDNTYLFSANHVASGSWMSATATDMTQDALDNHSGLINIFAKLSSEAAPIVNPIYASLENGVSADRPKWTIGYTEVAAGLMGGGLLNSSVLNGGGFHGYGTFGE